MQKKYRGYVEFPLPIIGASDDDMFAGIVCKGDFEDAQKRHQIFKRPRKYKLSFCFFNDNDKSKMINEYAITEKISFNQMIELIKQLAHAAYDDCDDSDDINLSKSCFRVGVA